MGHGYQSCTIPKLGILCPAGRNLRLSFWNETQTLEGCLDVKHFDAETAFTHCTLGRAPCEHHAGALQRCCQFLFGCLAVAGGGWGLEKLMPVFPCHSCTWRSPCPRAAAAWWGVPWIASSHRGQPGPSAPTRVAPAVSPCLTPLDQQCSTDSTHGARWAQAAPE